MQKCQTIFYDSVQVSCGELAMTSSGYQKSKSFLLGYIHTSLSIGAFSTIDVACGAQDWCVLSPGHPALQMGGDVSQGTQWATFSSLTQRMHYRHHLSHLDNFSVFQYYQLIFPAQGSLLQNAYFVNLTNIQCIKKPQMLLRLFRF